MAPTTEIDARATTSFEMIDGNIVSVILRLWRRLVIVSTALFLLSFIRGIEYYFRFFFWFVKLFIRLLAVVFQIQIIKGRVNDL
jgi:hypothetical protein